MGAIQLPVPAMRGWNIETRSQSFHVTGPGGHEIDNRQGLPIVRTAQGWWVSLQHIHGVLAALELAQASWDRYRAGILGPHAVDPGDDRGVQLQQGTSPDAHNGLVFTGLPEHAWGYTHLRSVEVNYAELKRLHRQGLALHRACDCAQTRHHRLLSNADLADWRLENDTMTMHQLLLLHIERGEPWGPGTRLPPAAELEQHVTMQRPLEAGATELALTRLAAEGHLCNISNLPGGPYVVPGPAPVPLLHPVRPPHRNTKKARLYQYVTEGITTKMWNPGERIPTQVALAAQCGVSQSHVSQVLRILADQGWLHRHPNVYGVFVVPEGAPCR